MKLPPPRHDPIWTLLRNHDIQELWDHSLEPHVAAAYRQRLELLLRLVDEVCSSASSRVLDVGCAQGTLGLMLAEKGHQVTLNDIRPVALEYANARREGREVSLKPGRLGEAVPANPIYDLVLCTEVLEHVKQPARLLVEISERLKPGGHLIITTPNADYFLSRLPSFGRASQAIVDSSETNSMDGDAHRYLFTREELVALARACGFAALSSGYFSPFWMQGHLKTRYFHRLLFAIRGRILEAPDPTQRVRGFRKLCASQYLVARFPPRTANHDRLPKA